jgi:diguanylate cyclase (GGDEF)-like protein
MAEQALTSFSHLTGDKPIVLIADDSRVVRVSLKNILKEDCQVIEAENGQQAWDILSNAPSISLVFSDLSMPELDGRSLLKKIRASDSSQIATVPFIVVTGNEKSQEIHQELIQLGANEVVNKPFDPSNIRYYLTTMVSRKQDICQPEANDSQKKKEVEPQSDFIDGVINREEFMESASRELAFAIRNKNELSVALIQIDQIDELTTHYSDPAIEHILLTLVDIIKQHIHPDDTLAYFGNGLLTILRPASNAIGTRYLGRRILEDLTSKQFYLGESEEVVSVSIGISAPNIKPGTRLIELLSLAEARLKTAIKDGGNKVIDKGSESSAQVNLVSNTSELSNTTLLQSASTRNTTEIQRQSSEQVAEIKAKYGFGQGAVDDETSELIEHKQIIEHLTNENRQLINEIAHWKKQSAEAEHIRRQLFEIESQQQQLQVKFSALQKENTNLAQQTEAIESENRNLLQRAETLESENKEVLPQAERVTRENQKLLKRIQALEVENQILTDGSFNNPDGKTGQITGKENKRLVNQLNELTSRAEKAEAENLKSSQLVNSLNDNIKLLTMQLDQLQQQLTEEQKKNQRTLKASAKNIGRDSNDLNTMSQLHSHSDFISDSQNSELSPDPLPESVPHSAKSQTASVSLFPEQDQIQSKRRIKNKPTIPPFRVEPEPLLFKNGFHLSSFTIASMLFTVMLIVGGIYLRSVLNEDPTANMTLDQTTAVAKSGQNPAQAQSIADNSTTTKTSTNATRLERELELRKMAEEEFNRKVQ